MYRETSSNLFQFIEKCPTACHTSNTVSALLKEAGFTQLSESEPWALKPGGRFYITRGMSALIAFQLPMTDYTSFLITAAHGDSPGFKVKENPRIISDKLYARLNTEVYGGIDLSLWMDRPLSVAGKVVVQTEEGIAVKLINIDRDLVMIPSLAVHMRHGQDRKLSPAVDSIPLYGMEKSGFMSLIAETVNVDIDDILSHDLHLYCREKGTFYGENNEFIASPRLDDLQCVFASLQAFLSSSNSAHVPVMAVLDSEEIGSMTKQGADSTFLSDVLHRIGIGCGKSSEEISVNIGSSVILSADNGHAVHPNFPEKSDSGNCCHLNGGVVIKHSPRYATDTVSAAIVKFICDMAGVPTQTYYNRSDIPGGSTLGNISGTHVSAHTADIGLAQLSMHSPYETAGAMDTEYMVKAMTMFYCSSIAIKDGGARFIINDNPKSANNSLWQDISSFSGQL